MNMITRDVLIGWDACKPGRERFCELFPEGATLKVAIDGLVADGHDAWGLWLFEQCSQDERFKEQTLGGYMNSGNWNSGNRNSGNMNSGNWNSGNWNSGNRNSGNWNTGNMNTGNWNSGNWNSGNRNSGNWNTGNMNTGNWNSGNRNSGDKNTGNMNTGNMNTGDMNSGNWNSGNRNSGYFNSNAPDKIRAFNKPCDRARWDGAKMPRFIYQIETVWWVVDSEMTDQEKIDDPGFYVLGGQLRTRPYKEACKLAWDNRGLNDEAILRALPNFDAAVFFEITGIDVDASVERTGGGE